MVLSSVAVVAAVLGSLPTTAAAQGGSPGEEEALGRRLYVSRCATCHGDRGEGTDLGPQIRGLGPAAYDFVLTTGRMPIPRPVSQPVRKPPAFNADEIDALVAYLEGLEPGGVPIPAVDPEAGNLSQGQQVYQANCAACHGATGGGAAFGRSIAPGLGRATALQVAEAVRYGPGAMPVFGAEVIPDPALDSLVRYVLFLTSSRELPASGLGPAGPIIEGFVALLFGLGGTMLVLRLMGRRA